MSPPRKRRVRKRWIAAAALLSCGLIVLIIYGGQIAAWFLQTWIIPATLEERGIKHHAVVIQSIGLHRAEFGPVRLGPAENPTLTVKSFTINYSPMGVFDRVVEGISIDGVIFNVAVQGGEVVTGLPAIDARINAATSPADPAATSDSAPRLTIKRCEISDASIAIAGPFPVRVDVPRLSGFLIDGEAAVKGAPLVTIQSFKLDDVTLTSPLTIPLLLDGSLDGDGDWRVDLQVADGKTMSRDASLRFGETEIAIPPVALKATARHADGKLDSRVEIQTAGLAGKVGDVSIDFGAASVNVQAVRIDDAADVSFTAEASSRDIEIETPWGTARTPRLKLDLSGRGGAEGVVELSSRTTLVDGEFIDESNGVQLSRINVNLPLDWGGSGDHPEGAVKVGSIRVKSFDLGSATLSVGQLSSEDLALTGSLAASILPELQAGWTFVPLGDEGPALSISGTGKSLRPDLAAISATFAGTEFTGTVSFSLTVPGGSGDVPELTLSLSDGMVSLGDDAITLDGLKGRLTIPRLVAARSPPRQSLTFETARSGKLTFSSGEIHYQLEGGETVFIENGKMNWCEGELTLDPIRVKSAGDAVAITLRCERVNLSEFFLQCAPALATGEGRVSGKIPIRFRSGSITFDGAVLRTKPGDGGILRMTGGSIAGAGLPVDSPQRIQLEMADAALKEFEYEWLEIKANSKNDEEVVSISVFGKPTRPIPFKYESDRYVRVEHQGEVRVKRSMRLDVNVTFSLDDVLNLGGDLSETIQSSIDPKDH